MPERPSPACLRAADEAERALALDEAAELLERVLPYLADPRERARCTRAWASCAG